MRLEPRFLRWGIFFVLLGAIPLAVGQGWLTADAVGGAWRLWPLILIGMGVGVLVRRTPLHAAGGLIVAATFGLIFGSFLVNGASGLGCASTRPGPTFGSQDGRLASGDSVSVELDCGRASVHAVTGTGWALTGSGPTPRLDIAPGRLGIRSARRTFFLGGLDGSAETWDLALPADPTLTLHATVNAGDADVHLGGMHLDALSMTTNAGRTTLDLTEATVGSLSYTLNTGSSRIALPTSGLSGSATVNAGDLGLCVPSGAGLRIESRSVLASNDYAAHGLIQSGSTWTSPGYDAATVRIDLTLTANAGSIRLDPKGGCG
jgi:hypothetical protein